MFQGLRDQAANPASVATLGWWSLQAHIDWIRLLFLWRILLLPMTCVYKSVLIKRFCSFLINKNDHHSGPTWNLYKLCCQYNVCERVCNCIELGEYMSMQQWKNFMKPLVHERYIKNWKATCMLYKSLKYLNISLDHPVMSTWWQYVRHHPDMFYKVQRLIQLLLNKDRRFHERCENCGSYEYVSLEHVLFECPAKTEIRNCLWSEIKMHCPTALAKDIEEMNSLEKCRFICNGLNSRYIKEWDDLYTSLVQFVWKMSNE